MNFDKISNALLLCFDALQDDNEAEEILEIIDSAGDDAEIKKGLTLAIARLKVTKPTIAAQVEADVKGFI